MTNSSGWFCPYPSCFIQPDGRILSQIEDHREDLMMNDVDLSLDFYDPMKNFRQLVIDGALTNGSGPVDDPRSKDTTCL